MKYCSKCKKELPKSSFYGNNTLSPYCIECTKKYRRERRPLIKDKVNRKLRERRANDPEFRDKINQQKREHFRRRVAYYKVLNARQRAERKGIEFSITEEDIEIPEYCPLLGIKIEVGTRKNYENSPSLDRKDPSKGYVKGNVWIVSKKANSMKNSASLEELELLVKNLKKYLK